MLSKRCPAGGVLDAISERHAVERDCCEPAAAPESESGWCIGPTCDSGAASDRPTGNTVAARVDKRGVTVFRTAGALAVMVSVPWLSVPTAHADSGSAVLERVPVTASSSCAGDVMAEAQAAPTRIDGRDDNGVRVAIHYDAGIYDGSCALTVSAAWRNTDTGASGQGDITAVSTIDGHYGFIGYAETAFATGAGTVVVTLSSHPGEEMRITA